MTAIPESLFSGMPVDPAIADKDTLEEATSIAKSTFGYSALWEDQAAAITAVMRGEDVLVIQRTGFGKSAVYQIPALMSEGLTLVFSPLIALMRDQVQKLKGWGVKADRLSSDMSDEACDKVVKRMHKLNLLYVAPERLKNAAFMRRLKAVDVAFAVVDEAHVLSHAMRDFRPAYRLIGSVLNTVLKDVPRMALTATCDGYIERDVARILGLKSYTRIANSPVRPNLTYSVYGEMGEEDIASFVKNRYPGVKGIVYASTRARTFSIARAVCAKGVIAEAYHAGIPGEKRGEIQDRFKSGVTPIIVATNAFGMGVDVPDIRFVFHADPPGSIHDYAQESGRGGRDGLPAACVLNMTKDGLRSRRFFIRTSNPGMSLIDVVWDVFMAEERREPFRTDSRKLSTALKDIAKVNPYDAPHYIPNILGYLEYSGAIVTKPDKIEYQFAIRNRERLAEFLDRYEDDIRVSKSNVYVTIRAGDYDWSNQLLGSTACAPGDFPPTVYTRVSRLRDEHGINEAELSEKKKAAEERLILLEAFARTNDHAAFLTRVFSGKTVEQRVVEDSEKINGNATESKADDHAQAAC